MKAEPVLPANPLQHQTFVVIFARDHASIAVTPHADPCEL